VTPPPAPLKSYWQCPRCTAYNAIRRTLCGNCQELRHEPEDVPATAHSGTGPVLGTSDSQRPGKAAKPARKWHPYRSYTEKRAAEWLVRQNIVCVAYEAIKVRLADGAWYCPDFVQVGMCLPRVAWEVKNAAHDCRNSLATQRRVLRVAKERLAELGIELRLLVWDGKAWQEKEV
jgi:hypothetical protein